MCLQQKAKKSIHALFGKIGESEREDERANERRVKILSVPSSSCPDAGLRSTFPICVLSLSRVESRRRGVREQDREGERVSNSGVRLSQSVKSVRQSGRQEGSVY